MNEQQDLWIDSGLKNVKKHAFFMRKAMDEDNMEETLRHSAALLSELRTSLLGPQKYYQLYVAVNDHLQGLQAYFSEQPTKPENSTPYPKLYQLVQHAGNVVPRLYLVCTVGASWIRSKQAPAKVILQDMADMCKGVQHPTRGLFLRAYLVQVCRGLLPDSGSEYAEVPNGGDCVDAVEFLLYNFTEMNKLWVRMKFQNGQRGAMGEQQREKERQQLADLVGKNLTQLSQLEGLTFELYRDVVLPRVLEQIIACKDELAQSYLMQCIAAVFSDDFHVGTLETLLAAIPQLQPGVKLATVMGSLLERLANYAVENKEVVGVLDSSSAFSKMSNAVDRAVEAHPDLPPGDLAALYGGLLSFAGVVYPERVEYVDSVLLTCFNALEGRKDTLTSDVRSERQLVGLLTAPLERYGVKVVLGLKHYKPMMGLLSGERKREMSRRLAEEFVRKANSSTESSFTAQEVDILFDYLEPLITDGEDIVALDDEDVAEDAGILAKLVPSLVTAAAIKDRYQVLNTLLTKTLAGGQIRVSTIIPPIAFAGLQAVKGETETEKKELWYRFIHRCCSSLADARAAPLALELFLAAALSASEDAKVELMAYECLEQAFILFEEALPDSIQEIRALHSIIKTLSACSIFKTSENNENRETLVHKASSYCTKLLKRRNQCLAVLASAHLFADDPKGVLNCLKRALRIANAAQQQLRVVERSGKEVSTPGWLFLEILNAYLYWNGRGGAMADTISSSAVQSVVELVETEVQSEGCLGDEELQGYYKRTMKKVKEMGLGK